jgi:ABC-type phosphate transport system permease subunit
MKSKTSRLIPSTCILTVLLAATTVQAQDTAPVAPLHPTLLHSVTPSVIFGIVGIVLAIIGFKLFDLVTPFNLEKEIQEKNLAVGILCAAIVLGICHIIAASMS